MPETYQSEASLDDMIDNPHKYGLPTIEEFSKNPEKFRTGVESLFEVADKGSTNLNRLIRKHEYRIMGYKCKTLEEVQKIMNAEGRKLDEYVLKPELVRDAVSKLTCIVTFVLKDGGIIGNGNTA
jgi:hypothetical protein